MTKTAWLVLAAAPLQACVAVADCAGSVPADLRADAIRVALERGMVLEGLVPRDDLTLAYGAGTPWDQLTEERRRLVSGPAAGYASCVRERSSR